MSKLADIENKLASRVYFRATRVFLVDYDQAQLFARGDGRLSDDLFFVVFSGPDPANQPNESEFPRGTLFWRSPDVPQGADAAIKRVFYKLRHTSNNIAEVFIVHGGGTGDKGYDAMVAIEKAESGWCGSLSLIDGKKHRPHARCDADDCKGLPGFSSGAHSVTKCRCGRTTCPKDSTRWLYKACNGPGFSCDFSFCTHQHDAGEVPDHLLTCEGCGDRYCPRDKSAGHGMPLCGKVCSKPMYVCQAGVDRVDWRRHLHESDEHLTGCPVDGCKEEWRMPKDCAGSVVDIDHEIVLEHLLNEHNKYIVDGKVVNARSVDSLVDCPYCGDRAPQVKVKNYKRHVAKCHP